MALARGSHNSVLAATLETIRDALYEQVQDVQRLPGAAERACGYHRQIAEAVTARDGDRAERVMLEHLNDVEGAVLASIANNGSQ